MNARDDILGAVRRAVAAGPPVGAPPARVPGRPAAPDLLDRFVERVEDYRATVTRCQDAEVAAAILAALAGATSTILPEGFGWPVPGAVADIGQSASGLDALDAVVTAATVAVAETGTLVLTHGPGEGRRALSLVPDLHVCVVRADQVVADVPDAMDRLDPLRPQTWISGPSATSDIELSRVEGVHGPRTLHVIVVVP
ncbi:LutC/YkgG family protein [Streptomyces sp. NPDC001212]|uniref:LutC/YkgG family protein n=1 Tax=Streptomyces sp. HYC2 TaxID=2955207 RepID=UPI002481536A|nr:LUD domain-containing protein [Streptomyces sp. HYC2]